MTTLVTNLFATNQHFATTFGEIFKFPTSSFFAVLEYRAAYLRIPKRFVERAIRKQTKAFIFNANKPRICSLAQAFHVVLQISFRMDFGKNSYRRGS